MHYILLAAIALMLVSGPLAGWASGGGITVFSLHFSGVQSSSFDLYALAQRLHIAGALALALGTLAHVAGVLKHMFIDKDHTLDRIMVPPARQTWPARPGPLPFWAPLAIDAADHGKAACI